MHALFRLSLIININNLSMSMNGWRGFPMSMTGLTLSFSHPVHSHRWTNQINSIFGNAFIH